MIRKLVTAGVLTASATAAVKAIYPEVRRYLRMRAM
jgi:hypothetical protein